VAAVEQLIDAVERSNEYAVRDEDDRNRRLEELRAGRSLLSTKGGAGVGVLAAVLTYLAIKFSDGIIGGLADLAFENLLRLVGS